MFDSNKWDYAELSRAAKVAGGPEEFVNKLIEVGREKERADHSPEKIFGEAIKYGLGSLAVTAVRRVIECVQNADDLDVDKIRASLICGIREYDNSH